MPLPAWAIPAGISIIGGLFGKKKQRQQPTFQAPPVFQPVRDSQVYGPLLQDFQRYQAGGQALSPAYRDAVLGQGTRELDVAQKRAHQQAFEQFNKMGLLGSGAMGVRGGLIDEGYSRALQNIIQSLTQQELGQYNTTVQRLAGMEGAQATQSQNLAALAYQSQRDKHQSEADVQGGFLSNLGNIAQQAMMPQYLRQYGQAMGQGRQQPIQFGQSPLGMGGGGGYQLQSSPWVRNAGRY